MARFLFLVIFLQSAFACPNVYDNPSNSQCKDLPNSKCIYTCGDNFVENDSSTHILIHFMEKKSKIECSQRYFCYSKLSICEIIASHLSLSDRSSIKRRYSPNRCIYPSKFVILSENIFPGKYCKYTLNSINHGNTNFDNLSNRERDNIQSTYFTKMPFTCEENYLIRGTTSSKTNIVCNNSTGTFTKPVCDRGKCAIDSALPLPTQNWTFKTRPTSGFVYMGDDIILECDTGFSNPSDNNEKEIPVNCVNLNTFDIGSMSTFKCVPYQCKLNPVYHHLKKSDTNPYTLAYPSGTETLQCQQQYHNKNEGKTQFTYTCSSDTPLTTPLCTPFECTKTLPSSVHGTYKCSGTTFSKTCEFLCHRGYGFGSTQSNRGTIRCTSGNKPQPTPECKPLRCDKPTITGESYIKNIESFNRLREITVSFSLTSKDGYTFDSTNKQTTLTIYCESSRNPNLLKITAVPTNCPLPLFSAGAKEKINIPCVDQSNSRKMIGSCDFTVRFGYIFIRPKNSVSLNVYCKPISISSIDYTINIKASSCPFPIFVFNSKTDSLSKISKSSCTDPSNSSNMLGSCNLIPHKKLRYFNPSGKIVRSVYCNSSGATIPKNVELRTFECEFESIPNTHFDNDCYKANRIIDSCAIYPDDGYVFDKYVPDTLYRYINVSCNEGDQKTTPPRSSISPPSTIQCKYTKSTNQCQTLNTTTKTLESPCDLQCPPGQMVQLGNTGRGSSSQKIFCAYSGTGKNIVQSIPPAINYQPVCTNIVCSIDISSTEIIGSPGCLSNGKIHGTCELACVKKKYFLVSQTKKYYSKTNKFVCKLNHKQMPVPFKGAHCVFPQCPPPPALNKGEYTDPHCLNGKGVTGECNFSCHSYHSVNESKSSTGVMRCIVNSRGEAVYDSVPSCVYSGWPVYLIAIVVVTLLVVLAMVILLVVFKTKEMYCFKKDTMLGNMAMDENIELNDDIVILN